MGESRPPFPVRIDIVRSLVQESSVYVMPSMKGCLELRMPMIGELHRQCTQTPGSLTLRPTWDVLPDGLHLVELAILTWYAGVVFLEHPDHTRLTVDDKAPDIIADSDQGMYGDLVISDTLTGGISPVEVLFLTATEEESADLVQ